jgi:hypothetical protein
MLLRNSLQVYPPAFVPKSLYSLYILDHPDQSLLVKSANTETSAEENQAAITRLRRIARDEGVDATMNRYKLDAIAILMDSPLAGVAAAAGKFFILCSNRRGDLANQLCCVYRIPSLHNAPRIS